MHQYNSATKMYWNMNIAEDIRRRIVVAKRRCRKTNNIGWVYRDIMYVTEHAFMRLWNINWKENSGWKVHLVILLLIRTHYMIKVRVKVMTSDVKIVDITYNIVKFYVKKWPLKQINKYFFKFKNNIILHPSRTCSFL